MDRLMKQVEFINEIEKLKVIKRQNMTLDNHRPENSAEHSWHLAMMAIVMTEHCQEVSIDKLKVIKMLLIHDLVEIYDGDTSLFDDKARKEAEIFEKKALKKITSILPEDQRDEMVDLWYEFEKGNSEEAKYAKVLDALHPLMNHLVTAPDNYNPSKLKAKEVIEKKKFIKTTAPNLWPLVIETIEKSVAKGLYESID